MSAIPPLPPVEPELDMDDIQGIAVPGFLKPSQVLLTVWHDKDAATLVRVRAFLRELQVTSAADALADRRTFRLATGRRKPAEGTGVPTLADRPVLTGIGFTYAGLRHLASDACELSSDAFKLGLAARSALLGDPTDETSSGHPSAWRVGKRGDEADFMLVLAGDVGKQVRARAKELEGLVRTFARAVDLQGGHRLPGGREHFGFADGISQPGIRGRASDQAGDYVTDRLIAAADWPASSLYGLPGQDLVWPGEFVIGYARSGPDPLQPGVIDDAQPRWARNGSFLVYRRLKQDHVQFWNTFNDQLKELKAKPGFRRVTKESLAAHLIGRHPSGAPLSRRPGHGAADSRALGSNPYANNHFRFDSPTPRLQLLDGHDDFPSACADPLGLACPLSSHIRKVNPRDSTTDVGGSSVTYSHRILRIGLPYGTPYRSKPRGTRETEAGDRGLLFLCIQASIEDQFEFLQARWLNDDSRPKAPSGRDLIAGASAATPVAPIRCTISGSGGEQANVAVGMPHVTPTGGGYFFVPSLRAIAEVLSQPVAATAQ